MKFRNLMLAVFATSVIAVSCSKEEYQDSNGPDRKAAIVGKVYTVNNQMADNRVMVFDRHADGSIDFDASYSAGGTGTGGGLGNQGAIAMSSGGQYLYVINAGSDEISSMRVTRNGLVLADKISSGGTRPVSITNHNNLVYVLNAGGNGNITGFTVDPMGNFTAIPNSTKSLSSNMAGAAQVSFSPGGGALIVTEKATNTISSYAVNGDGTPGSIQTLASAGATPFGFSFGRLNSFVVTEAAGGAMGASTVSSYRVHSSGAVTLIDGPFATGESAACWAVTTNDGKNVFVTNTAGPNISSIAVDSKQNLSLGNGGNTTASDAGPIDAALSNNSQYLYVLNAGAHTITSYSVGKNGALTHIDTDGGLPAGATGLASK